MSFGTVKIKYRELCECIWNNTKWDVFLRQKYELDEHNVSLIIETLNKSFLPHFNKRLKDVSRDRNKFKNKYAEWMDHECIFSLCDPERPEPRPEPTEGRIGRPSKSFNECGDRSKRNKIRMLRELYPQSLINAAATKEDKDTPQLLSDDQALALFLQANLTKFQYEMIRQVTKNYRCRIFPNYKNIMIAKKKCYPDNLSVTETSATVPLQDLLDHTSKRILETKPADELEKFNNQVLTLTTKWGFDGASCQNEFAQKFSTGNDWNDDLIWNNSRPSSTRLCRPLRFSYEKETLDLARAEKNRVEDEQRKLEATKVVIDTNVIFIRHLLVMTMLDGKVAQAITNTKSASACFICGALPSEMNDLTKLRLKPLNDDALKFGISPLHARIKCMEYILHVSYNKDFEQWRTTKDTRDLKENEKKRIQKEFLERVGIRLDFVKQGYGSSNTGNTARRFFKDPALTSEITKIDKILIQRIATILEVINSNSIIDSEKFRLFAQETAEIAIQKYPWYYMPSTVHKLLLHGADIVQNSILPVGILSEEAQESRNKDYKNYRINYSRKTSRTSTNEDILHKLLETSDPYITHMRPEPKKKHLPLSNEAKELLI